MFKLTYVWFQIVVVGLSVQWISFTSTQDIDRLIKHHSDNAISYHQQMVSSFGQRPTQFVTPLQAARGPIHSNGGLILPANNRIGGNNLQVLNYPSKYSPVTTDTTVILNTVRDSAMQRAEDSDEQSRFQRKSDDVAVSQTINQPNQMRNYMHGNIDSALRQTSTDENVFQPSPAFNIPDSRDLEPWSLQSSSSLPATSANLESSNYNHRQEVEVNKNRDVLTTEQSNVIAPTREFLPESQSTSEHQSPEISILPHYHQNEYPSSSGPVTVSDLGQHPNLTSELHNNVVYEGPATAPPPGDFYFSSSERLPNNGKASNIWWSLGIGHEFEKASNLTRDDYLDYCANSELLITNRQRSLCRTHPRIMPIVARGLKMAIDECQFRFTSNRWNCSLVLQDSMADASDSSKSQPFGEVMKHPNRERSFLNAIVAAGLAHAMTKACSNGELPEECSCDKKIKSKNNRGKIEWVACSDDIDYGARFSRDFIDNTDNDSDTTSMINTHNYEVGRRVFKSGTDITCTCQNGENGLCLTKRCWKHLGSFTDIGDELMRRYDSATHVQLSSKDPHKLRPVRRGVRKPKRKDLVYIDESPDYCTPNPRLGVLGTQNRRCNSTSSGPDSCSLLCCGRGYQVVVEEIEEDCNCKFVWCCQVKCDKCRRQITNDVCN